MNIRLNLLGQFELYLDGVEQQVRARKTRALIAWLAVHVGKPQPRSKLANLLWGDSGTQQARQSLRQAVADLRRVLGDAAVALDADTERLFFAAGSVTTDVAEFERLATGGDEAELVSAGNLYRGDFMDSEDPRSETFDEWIMAEQSRLAEVHQALLHRLVDSYRHTDLNEAIRFGQRIVSLDPLQGQMHRRLMELYRDAGRPEDAIRQFRNYKEILGRELGIEPEVEAQALLEEIVAERQHVSTPSAESTLAVVATNELRQVAVLAVNARNLADAGRSKDPEAYAEIVDALESAVRDVTTIHGGIVVQSSPDLSLAIFGLPNATGVEIRRCMEAAIEIRNRAAGEIPVSIAIASGQVMVNPRGDLEQAHGSVLNQVADFSRQSAAGDIVAPADVIEALAHVVEHEVIESPTAEGVRQVRIHAITDERLLTPFAGRKLQMQQLKLALEACKDTGLGQTILIRGEPGLGKSRLVMEVVTAARETGFTAARANLSPTTDSNISNLTRLVTRILEFDENITPDAVYDEDLVRLGMGKGQRSALIDLLDLEMPEDLRDFWESMSDERRQETRRTGLESIVVNATRENPVLTVIEDLQWAEPSILARIGVLASIVADYPMVLLLTSRLDETLEPSSWRGPSHKAPFTTMDLTPLREVEALELGRHMRDDDELILGCFRRSGGNPLFLEQLLRSEAVSTQHIPDSIQSLVEATIYQLASQDLDAIQAASVLGSEFTSEALLFLLGSPSYSPLSLLRQRLIFKEGDTFEFSHALIRESTYKTMLRSRRSALHLRAAEYYKSSNRALFVDHLLSAESENAPSELLAIAQQEQKLHRHDRARILVRKGLVASADEETRKAFQLLEDNLLSSDPGWEELARNN